MDHGDQTPPAADFNARFCAHTRAARKACRMTQARMAAVLDVTEDAYEKYESRSPLPHYLVGRFVEITGAELGVLFPAPDDEAPRRRREAT